MVGPRIVLVVSCALAPVCGAHAQDPTPPNSRAITVAEAVEEALQHNLALMAERSNLSIADASMVAARLRPNPVVSVSADHLDWLGTGFNEINNGGPPEIAARVDVPFERGRKREARIDVASFLVSAAQAQFAEAVRALRGDVTQAAVDVIAAKATRDLVADNLRAFEELARVNQARATAGSIAPFESTRAQVAMLQFRSTMVRADLDLATAQSRLRTLIGRSPAEPLELATGLSGGTAGPMPELAEVQRLALTTRPDLRALELSQARSLADLRLQEALGKVDYTIGAEYRRQQGIAGTSNSVGVFFSAPLPISNRNQGEIARAGAEGQQAARQIAARRAQIGADVQSAYHEYVETRGLVLGMERDLLQPATSVRDIAAYTYRTGGSTLLELLDAQRAFTDTMQSYVEAQASLRRAVARLNTAVATEVVQ
ncbi:MAG TPA: TolC family protein [Vicinamibacterales bacterium]|jgi:cobalt-zinc-cadmium efflux system outer membrane protein